MPWTITLFFTTNHQKIMKTTKLLAFCILFLGFFSASAAYAQGMDPAAFKERMITQYNEIMDQLDLTVDQKEKVDPMIVVAVDKRLESMEEVRASGDFQGMREMMEKQEEEFTTQLAEVLTEAQLTKYKELREEQNAQRRQRMGGM